MQIDKSLIEKFLDNRCDAEDANLVHQHLAGHPELLQQYGKQDWQQSDEGESLDSQESEDILKAISSQTYARKTTVRQYLPWMAAAAVLVLSLSIWLFQPSKKDTVSTRQVVAVVPAAGTIKQPAYQWQRQHNLTSRKMKISLQDGSVVTLSPGAGIRYAQPFLPGKRDIYLEGQALFEVMKDKSRPFTVYSGELTTTALGTAFEVTCSLAAIKVRLLSGKVVVRSVKEQLPGWKKDVFLLPGQQLQYDAMASLVKVSGTGKVPSASGTPIAANMNERSIVFDNTPMPQVMEKLMDHYHIPINYIKEEIQELNFSGAVYHDDPLPVILQIIGRMNNLSVTSGPDGFRMRRVTKE